MQSLFDLVENTVSAAREDITIARYRAAGGDAIMPVFFNQLLCCGLMCEIGLVAPEFRVHSFSASPAGDFDKRRAFEWTLVRGERLFTLHGADHRDAVLKRLTQALTEIGVSPYTPLEKRETILTRSDIEYECRHQDSWMQQEVRRIVASQLAGPRIAQNTAPAQRQSIGRRI